MTPAEASRVLSVPVGSPHAHVRQAYLSLIRDHHPDRAGDAGTARATRIIEAYRILSASPAADADDPIGDEAPTPPPATGAPGPSFEETWSSGGPDVRRADAETIVLHAPADEAFRWLLDAAHDVGEITYVDRSMPIMEVLCQFEGEPATSLVITLQGRSLGTEAFCTVESIEARPAPPAHAVVDLLELALHRRRGGSGDQPPMSE